MNYLISAYSVNPYLGSEDSIGWNWVLQHEKHYKDGDRIILLTKKFNEDDTRKGLVEFGIKHVELVIVDVPNILNWFREKHSMFHHMYYILWQHWAWLWVKHSGIKFDVIHHVTMNDYRIPGEMYRNRNAYKILGPIGGAQVTPKSLECYEKNIVAAKFREMINISTYNPFYKKAVRSFDAIYCINHETKKQIEKIVKHEIELLPELALREDYVSVQKRNSMSKTCRIIFVGRLFRKKGIQLLLDSIQLLPPNIDWELDIYGDGEDKKIIEDVVEKMNEKKKIHLKGNCSYHQIVEAYRKGDIFVLPSLRETSGNVLLEAMAYSIPIVALDTSFCTVLKEKECGIFINPNQTKEKILEDFASAILQLIENDNLRMKYGKNGYKFANALTWDNKFEHIYGRIVER